MAASICTACGHPRAGHVKDDDDHDDGCLVPDCPCDLTAWQEVLSGAGGGGSREDADRPSSLKAASGGGNPRPTGAKPQWYQCEHCPMMTTLPDAQHYDDPAEPHDRCEGSAAGHHWLRLVPERATDAVPSDQHSGGGWVTDEMIDEVNAMGKPNGPAPPDPQTGICGVRGPKPSIGIQATCDLPAGHRGWHHDGGSSWNFDPVTASRAPADAPNIVINVGQRGTDPSRGPAPASAQSGCTCAVRDPLDGVHESGCPVASVQPALPWTANEMAVHRRVAENFPVDDMLRALPGDHVRRWLATVDALTDPRSASDPAPAEGSVDEMVWMDLSALADPRPASDPRALNPTLCTDCKGAYTKDPSGECRECRASEYPTFGGPKKPGRRTASPETDAVVLRDELSRIRGAVGALPDEGTYEAVKRNQVEIAITDREHASPDLPSQPAPVVEGSGVPGGRVRAVEAGDPAGLSPPGSPPAAADPYPTHVRDISAVAVANAEQWMKNAKRGLHVPSRRECAERVNDAFKRGEESGRETGSASVALLEAVAIAAEAHDRYDQPSSRAALQHALAAWKAGPWPAEKTMPDEHEQGSSVAPMPMPATPSSSLEGGPGFARGYSRGWTDAMRFIQEHGPATANDSGRPGQP